MYMNVYVQMYMYMNKYYAYEYINPYHVEFLKWNNPLYIFGSVHYHFKGYQDENLKLVSQRLAWLYTGGKG